MTRSELQQKAAEYTRLKDITLDFSTPLGFGQDGCVWKSNRQTAVKVLERQRAYEVELECYRRFQEHQITKLHGFSIPQLIACSDDLQIIEIRTVTPPYLLDFAKAWLDRPADFPPETMEDWESNGEEPFERRWPEVKTLLSALQQFGIFYYDAKPANIRFAN